MKRVVLSIACMVFAASAFAAVSGRQLSPEEEARKFLTLRNRLQNEVGQALRDALQEAGLINDQKLVDQYGLLEIVRKILLNNEQPDPRVRSAALGTIYQWWVFKLTNHTILDDLLKVLEEDNAHPILRAEAARVLGEIPQINTPDETRVVTAFRELFKERSKLSPTLAISILKALGERGRPNDLVIIKPLLAEKDPELRGAAINAMLSMAKSDKNPEFPDAGTSSSLVEKLADKELPSASKVAIVEVISVGIGKGIKIPQAADKVMAELGKQADDDLDVAIAKAGAQIQSETALPLLVNFVWTKDKSPDAYKWAVYALQSYFSKYDKSGLAQTAAEKVKSMIEGEGLIKMLKEHDDVGVKNAAADVMGGISSKWDRTKAVEALVGAFDPEGSGKSPYGSVNMDIVRNSLLWITGQDFRQKGRPGTTTPDTLAKEEAKKWKDWLKANEEKLKAGKRPY